MAKKHLTKKKTCSTIFLTYASCQKQKKTPDMTLRELIRSSYV